MKSITFLFLYMGMLIPLNAQDVIQLYNPSFEDMPRVGTVRGPAPTGWQDCGKPGESAPDIQPGFFNVTKQPSHGSTYLGMVIRDNDTWEAISQHLPSPLHAKRSYKFTLDLARSETYLSPARTMTSGDPDLIDHIFAAKLRIWGGRSRCSKLELLAESEMVDHASWKRYVFLLQPKETYSHILLEAFYQTPTPHPYNGNILLDNCSNITLVSNENLNQIDLKAKPVGTQTDSLYLKVLAEQQIEYEAKQKQIKALNEKRANELKKRFAISKINLGDKVFELIDPIYEKEVDELDQELRRTYFIYCLDQHLESEAQFRSYLEEYSFFQLHTTAKYLAQLDVDEDTLAEFIDLIDYLQKQDNKGSFEKALKKKSTQKRTEDVRAGLVDAPLRQLMHTYVQQNHDLIFQQLFTAVNY